MNEITILYGNAGQFNHLSLSVDNDIKIKDIIKQLSSKVLILSEYISLKCNNKFLEDDDYITKDEIKNRRKIVLYIKIKICRSYEYTNCRTLCFKYDATVDYLKQQYCQMTNYSDVKLSLGDFNLENILLRDYLIYENLIFTAFIKISVKVTNQHKQSCNFEAFENDTIKSLRNKLLNINFLHSKKDILMINDIILLDFHKIYRYGKFNCVNIIIGFYINVVTETGLLSVIVNFNTEVSELKQSLLNNFKECNLMSLIFNNVELEDRRTIGFYTLNEGCKVYVIIKIKVIILYINEGSLIEYSATKGKKIKEIRKELSKKYMVDVSQLLLFLYYREINQELIIDSLTFEERYNFQMEIKFSSKYSSEVPDSNNIKINNQICENRYIKEIGVNRINKCYFNPCLIRNNKILLINQKVIYSAMKKKLYFNCVIPSPYDVTTKNTHFSLMVINLTDDLNKNYIQRIMVEHFYFVQLVKQVISCDLMMDMSTLDIYHLGEVFNGGSLVENGITDNHSIILKQRKNKLNFGEEFIIKVRYEKNEDLKEEITEFIIDDFETVRGLKYNLHIKYQVYMKDIKLMLENQELKNSEVIKQLDIASGSTIRAI